MDLWIRSQDKTQLLKVIGLYYDYQKEKHHITCITENDYYWVGMYKTKERALEVLDEIQGILRAKFASTISGKEGFASMGKKQVLTMLNQMAVYEMPKE